MTFFRYLAFVALALWAGGLVALAGVAAPAIFELLQAHDPVAGRQMAGELFGVILGRFQYVAWLAAALLFLSYGSRAALGPRPRRTAVRIWIVAAMLAASLFTAFVIVPNVDAIRLSVEGPVAMLPADDARRIAFGRWHGLASVLAVATIIGGLGLAWAEMKDRY